MNKKGVKTVFIVKLANKLWNNLTYLDKKYFNYSINFVYNKLMTIFYLLSTSKIFHFINNKIIS